jgi:formamidopyrimidine-DNA glycosylase
MACETGADMGTAPRFSMTLAQPPGDQVAPRISGHWRAWELYASEMLHRCGIHPAARCDRLHGDPWTRLHAALLAVLESAIEHEGSTLSDGTYRNALNQAGGYQNQHRVYDRAGESCPTCGRGTIQRIVQAQRSTFFCPACQKKKASAVR